MCAPNHNPHVAHGMAAHAPSGNCSQLGIILRREHAIHRILHRKTDGIPLDISQGSCLHGCALVGTYVVGATEEATGRVGGVEPERGRKLQRNVGASGALSLPIATWVFVGGAACLNAVSHYTRISIIHPFVFMIHSVFMAIVNIFHAAHVMEGVVISLRRAATVRCEGGLVAALPGSGRLERACDIIKSLALAASGKNAAGTYLRLDSIASEWIGNKYGGYIFRLTKGGWI